LVLQLNNEIIVNCDPHIGLLHRGTEKLIENKIFIHSLPYFDRLDYVSTIIQEHTYCLAIENLLNYKNITKLSSIRVVFDELTRILNHLLAISCHSLDVGSMSPIFWAFEEREKIMEFYERVSGARMHTSFYKPTLGIRNISNVLLFDILNFSNNCFITFNEIHNVLSNSKIWKIRLTGVGAYDYNTALLYGLTGVMARCVGIKRDLRLNLFTTYSNYKYIHLTSYTSYNGDSYDRYLLRMFEMVESVNIIIQAITKYKYVKAFKKNIDKFYKYNNNMEYIINHFKYWSLGIALKKSIVTATTESPKGEFSINLFTDNSEIPYRCKIRSPSYHHLNFIKVISKNVFLADLVTLIGTIDIVFGEIDR